MPIDAFTNPSSLTVVGPLVVQNDTKEGRAGSITLNGASVLGPMVTGAVATPTGAAQTIATSVSNPISRTAPSGACTNAILQAGSVNGQICIVTNENNASTTNTITFNTTIATSFVYNDGTNPQVIKCGTGKMFIWIAALSAWVALEPFAG